MASFKDNTHRIMEGNESDQYTALVNEIRQNRAAQMRLEAVVDKAIYAGANMVKHSVSLNRLNTLALALADTKCNPMLAKMPRVLEYLGLQNCAIWNKAEKVFVVVNYANFKAIASNRTIPTVKFHTWLKDNKAQKNRDPLTAKQAAQKIRALFTAMRESEELTIMPEFQAIMQAMETHLQENDRDYCAAMEREKVRNLIGNN